MLVDPATSTTAFRRRPGALRPLAQVAAAVLVVGRACTDPAPEAHQAQVRDETASEAEARPSLESDEDAAEQERLHQMLSQIGYIESDEEPD